MSERIIEEDESLIKVSDDLYRVLVIDRGGNERWEEIDKENLILSQQ